MAGLLRQTMLIFSSTASSKLPSVFGSLANGSPTTATNVGTGPSGVQNLSGSYQGGWATAVLGTNSPAIEDLNALFWVCTYQIAYLLGRGISEWDSNTTYNTGDIVRATGGSPSIYASLNDSNTGNPVTDGTNWFTVPSNGVLTPNAVPWTNSMTVSSGKTLFWPFMNIGNGITATVASGANLVGVTQMIVSGTLIVNGTSRVL